VHGKGKSRKRVAPKSVRDYLERIRTIAKSTEPDARVFTTINGEPTRTLYQSLIGDLLDTAGLREGAQGVPRSNYCFRHTYATMRLHEGVDVYFLAEQMGTSVKMIEDHYGHVDTIKHADRVLSDMHDWEPTEAEPGKDRELRDAGAAKAIKAKQPKGPPRKR
jgi:integrase